MNATPADPRMAFDAASSQDLVQRKLSIDAMRKRVSGGQDKDAKLRESCEGFEAMFLQKMWEQMRKNVTKEGYLHSKDEETYQSMFDVELAGKMASAGGIGLGEMLYQQLNQRLTHASKTTGSGLGKALPITPASTAPTALDGASALSPANLYADVEEGGGMSAHPERSVLAAALADLERSRDPGTDPANTTYPMFNMATGAPLNPVADRIKEESVAQARRERPSIPLPERVSAPGKVRPSHAQGAHRATRNRKTVQAPHNAELVPAPPVRSSGDAAVNWPVTGEVSRKYGWEFNDKGNRSWNTGMDFAAPEGSPVTAPMGGKVAFVGRRDDMGQTVVLEHEGGLKSYYGNAVTSLAVGTSVPVGTQFANISAGADAGNAANRGRLHFSIRRGELALNPENVLTQGAGQKTPGRV